MASVQARIEDLRHAQGGHARIVVPGEGATVPEAVVVRRFDRVENYLSPDGWRVPLTRITPVAVETQGRDLTIDIGPDLTEWLEFGERIAIELPNGTQAQAIWPEIGAYLGGDPRKWRQLVGHRTQRRDPLPPSIPPAGAAAAPVPLPDPVVQTPIAAQLPKPRGFAGVWIALVILLLATGGGFAYWRGYLDPAIAQVSSWWSPRPTAVANRPPAATPEAPRPPADLIATIEQIAGQPPAEAFRIAERLWAQGSYDLAFQAFQDAATRGFGPANLAIGRMYDPPTFQQGRPFQRANRQQAVIAYQRALEAGVAEARPLVDRLACEILQASRGTDVAAAEARAFLQQAQLRTTHCPPA